MQCAIKFIERTEVAKHHKHVRREVVNHSSLLHPHVRPANHTVPSLSSISASLACKQAASCLQGPLHRVCKVPGQTFQAVHSTEVLVHQQPQLHLLQLDAVLPQLLQRLTTILCPVTWVFTSVSALAQVIGFKRCEGPSTPCTDVPLQLLSLQGSCQAFKG